jgi:hypothetical protein
MWCRWRAGQSLHEIGRAFGKNHSSIRCLVSHHGGFVPAVRRRSLLALTQGEREEISRGITSGSSIREIAKCLDRTASTVSREVARSFIVQNLRISKKSACRRSELRQNFVQALSIKFESAIPSFECCISAGPPKGHPQSWRKVRINIFISHF